MAILLNYTTSNSHVIGSCGRKVHCEHCGTTFMFLVEVKVPTRETRRFSLRSGNALERVSPNTERHVAYMLYRRLESVPCPSCYKYQADMCGAIRVQHLSWMKTAGVLLLVASGYGMFITYSNGNVAGSIPAKGMVAVRIAMLAIAALGAVLLVIRRMSWAAYDANSRIPEQSRREIAVGRALTEAEFAVRHPGIKAIEREQP